MKYLVDTNILIYLMNSKSARVAGKFTSHHNKDFGVSAITVAELIFGAKKSQHVNKNLNAVIKILSPFTILDFDSMDAMAYGDIRADLGSKGCIIGANDLLMAAQAVRRQLIMLTVNTREFERVEGLRAENWV